MDHCVVVDSPADMSRILHSACPAKAADFARAQHETACWGYDGQRAAFWQDVMAMLAEYRDGDRTAVRTAQTRRVA